MKPVNIRDPEFLGQFGLQKQNAIREIHDSLTRTKASLCLVYHQDKKTFTVFNSGSMEASTLQSKLETICKRLKWQAQVSGNLGENKKIVLVRRSQSTTSSSVSVSRSRERIRGVLGFIYKFSPLEQFENDLCVGSLMNRTCRLSKGFTIHQEVVSAAAEYHQFLKDSFTLCNNLMPRFITPLQWHEKALNYYVSTKEQRASIIKAMAETSEIAKTIASEYKKLITQLSTYREKQVKILEALQEEEYEVRDKLRKNNDENSTLQASKEALGCAIGFVCKIVASMADAMLFCIAAQGHSRGLGDDDGALKDSESFEIAFCESELEDFYFKWIALAKVNLAMKSAFQNSIPEPVVRGEPLQR